MTYGTMAVVVDLALSLATRSVEAAETLIYVEAALANSRMAPWILLPVSITNSTGLCWTRLPYQSRDLLVKTNGYHGSKPLGTNIQTAPQSHRHKQKLVALKAVGSHLALQH